METQTQEERGMYEYVKTITDSIFSKSLQEAPINRTLVGTPRFLAQNQAPKYVLYNPHNYRLYFDFKKAHFKPGLTGVYTPGDITPKLINSKDWLFLDFLKGLATVKVRKKTIEIVNKIDCEKWYKIELGAKGKEQIIEIIRQKDKETKNLLTQFIAVYGGKSEYKVLNRHSDNKLKGETIINNLDIKSTFQNQIVKKVYKENNVEFSDPAFMCNYITNQAIKELAPEIAKELDKLACAVSPLVVLKQCFRGVVDLIKDPSKVKLVESLSVQDREAFELFLFEFGGRYAKE